MNILLCVVVKLWWWMVKYERLLDLEWEQQEQRAIEKPTEREKKRVKLQSYRAADGWYGGMRIGKSILSHSHKHIQQTHWRKNKNDESPLFHSSFFITSFILFLIHTLLTQSKIMQPNKQEKLIFKKRIQNETRNQPTRWKDTKIFYDVMVDIWWEWVMYIESEDADVSLFSVRVCNKYMRGNT